MTCSDSALRSGTSFLSRSIVEVADRRHLWCHSLQHALGKSWPETSVTTLHLDPTGQPNSETGASAIVLVGGEGFARNTELQTDFDRIDKMRSGIPILLITDAFDALDVTEAMAIGAKGYLTSSVSIDLLIQVLRVLMVGGMAFPAIDSSSKGTPAIEPAPSPRRAPAQAPSIALFTPRELQVLAALGEGKPNKIIAYEFNICETTVKVHVSHVMKKLGATNRTHAAVLASEIAEDLRQAVQMQSGAGTELAVER